MKKWWYWLFPIAWMGVIFYSSSTPYEEQDLKPFLGQYVDLSFLIPYVEHISFVYHKSEVSVEALGINGFAEFFIRKGAHVGVFFVLMLLFFVAYRQTTAFSFAKASYFSLLWTVLYGVVDELHQGMTPNRTPYYGDVIIDSVGAFIGWVVIFIIARRKKLRKLN
ncbi:MAG: VanZ family protein [Bacillaceae bacterium]|nr:VanZ family protein [Bacillaceae bacterium]